MKKLRSNWLTMIFGTLSFIIFMSPVICSAESKLNIKGFYIGMPQQEAIENFKKLVNTKGYTISRDEIRKNIYKFGKKYDDVSNEITFMKFDSQLQFENNELVSLYLGSSDLNEIFDVSNVDINDFVKAFENAYHIKFNDSGIVDDNDNVKTAFHTFKDTTEGVAIQVRCNFRYPSNKYMLFKRIPKPGKMNFQ